MCKEEIKEEIKKEIKKNLLFIDIETTGLIGKNVNPKEYVKFNKCRMIELGYYIYDENGKKLKKYNELINSSIKINNTYVHGISNDMINKEGIKLIKCLEDIYKDICEYNVGIIVAHNINFDIRVLLAECYREKYKYLIDKILKMDKICTMLIFKNRYKEHELYKGCSLSKMYYFLTSRTFSGAHRALKDALICAKSYYKMRKKLK